MKRWFTRRMTTRATPSARSARRRAYNPRLQVKSVEEYVDLMNNLHLANPKMMDVAVPANMHQGWRRSRSRGAAGPTARRKRRR